MTDLKQVKEELYKVVNLKLEESRDEFELTYKSSLDDAKAGHPNLSGDELENKVLKILRNKYMAKLKSAGKSMVGYVIGYSDAADTNKYLLEGAVKALQTGKIEEFEKKNKCKVLPDGKVMKSTKDGTKQFEVKPRYQRTVYGFCKKPDGKEMVKFIMYWQFDSLENSKRPEMIGVPVRFRGIPADINEVGILPINSVKETEFTVIPGSSELPEYEELLKKFYDPVDLSKISKVPENSDIAIYGEVRYDPNPKYGDRLYVQINQDSMSLDDNADEVIVQFGVDFPMSQVEGFTDKSIINCCIMGQYRPYTSKEGKDVKKIQGYGVYVLKQDRPTGNTGKLVNSVSEDTEKSKWG